jgi:hypothetical protein
MPVAPSQMAAPDTARKMPIRLPETDLFKHPEFEGLVKDLFERYKNEGTVSRGTRNIAPNLFIGSERKGYFNHCRSNHIVLVYAYTGPEDYFREIVEEMYQYCAGKNFQLAIFAGKVIDPIDESLVLGNAVRRAATRAEHPEFPPRRTDRLRPQDRLLGTTAWRGVRGEADGAFARSAAAADQRQ